MNSKPLTLLVSLLAIVTLMLLGDNGVAAEKQAQVDMAPGGPRTPAGTGFTYQGQLKVSGSPANGSYDFTFALYDAATAGNQVGSTIAIAGQTVTNGLFTGVLDFGSNAFQGQARWLEIAVRQAGGGTYTTLAPRQPLTAVPYAASLATGSTGAVISGTVNGPALVVTNTNGAGIQGTSSADDGVRGYSDVASGVNGTSNGGVGVYGGSNNGIGVSAFSNSFYAVYGLSGSSYGGYFASNSSDGVYGRSTNGDGVHGQSTNGAGTTGYSSAAGGFGVFGSAPGSGMYGYSQTGTGVTGYAVTGLHGVYGQADSSNGIGVHGSGGGMGVKGESTNGFGVFGSTSNTNGAASGVKGEGNVTNGIGVAGSSNGSAGVGVFGYTNGGSSSAMYGYNEGLGSGVGVKGISMNGAGVYGESRNSSVAGVSGYNDTVFGQGVRGYGTYGIYGDARQHVVGSTYAGYFTWDINVNGWVYKSGGSFKIDHPLDPENKYLYHSFVESPDMMNIYNGNVTTDAKGDAVVTLPDYFEAVNKEFRYQLTPIGQFAQAIVASEVKNNSFTIKTDKPNVKVSWQVTGVRHDPYAEWHPMNVEEQKPLEEQGKYLHPEAYGLPESMGVGYEMRQAVLEPQKEPAIKP